MYYRIKKRAAHGKKRVVFFCGNTLDFLSKGETKMNDEGLRVRVKMLKATGSIQNYYEIAELLEMSKAAFYNWLSKKYNLGYEKKVFLSEIIETLTIA